MITGASSLTTCRIFVTVAYVFVTWISQLCYGKARQKFKVRVLPNQYQPFLRVSEFNFVLSSDWSFSELVRVTRTSASYEWLGRRHIWFYIRFHRYTWIGWFSSESLVRVYRMCITTFIDYHLVSLNVWKFSPQM